MSKRDDDSQADMEVGMTTAERRRRRRRGAGLRVPSDNVPRRSSTPPVVAPVPEDPALAMSIAYSFTSESAEPAQRTSREVPVPSFDNHEAMATVIDPVSGPIEQADFEMKTREMTAVNLEELGLEEPGASGALPIQRLSSPGIPVRATLSSTVEVRFAPRAGTDPAEDVELDLDASDDAVVDAGATLDQESGQGVEPGLDDVELDGGEPTTIHPGPPAPPPELAARSAPEPSRSRPMIAVAETSQARPPATEISQARPPATEASQPRPPMAMTETSQPRVPVTDGAPVRPMGADISQRMAAAVPPPAAAPVAPQRTTGRAQTVALSEDDLEEVREAARLGTQPQRPASTSTPPPTPPTKPVTASFHAVEPSVEPSSEPSSVPEIDILALEDKAAESSGEFEVDVEGIVEAKPVDEPPVEIPAAAALPPSVPLARESQPIPIVRDAHAPPPPPQASHKAPPAPPPTKKDKPPAAAARPEPREGREVREGRDGRDGRDAKPARGKPWFIDLFDEDYLRTLPFLTPQATQAEAEFVIDAMGLQPGGQVLDVGCGYGRHAMELAARGFHVVGLDLSTPLLVRGGEEAHRRGLTINFVRGDMRELDFDSQFDGAYCLFSTFGYFDDETNKKTIANIARALRPGGRVLIEILNRDYVIADLPTRVWWEGDGCVVLEEVDLNYFSSRIQINRSVVFDDGRQVEQEISVRAYSLHEVGKLLHAAGLRVLEVSGAYHTRGRFFGNQSRHIIVLAERKDPVAS